ncbi:ABC transporter substrate-binding protein [Salipiger sp. P9]|uniref:ABC transporter substrate-binding protein n=1 Tax=Salipiger pentaromativorans TaxID=2943193 RepID=UPI0021576056|nr:ABC transporter substrate-binding protein [Salipiger pentaromativorans]MCR8548869.1 ABC transporter substrate-binding protein [Salipiger pentaromativorans]
MLTIRQIPDRLRALGSAALTAGLVFAAGAATAEATLTTAWPSDVTSLDPVAVSNSPDMAVAFNVYQGLVGFSFERNDEGSYIAQGSELAPALAESWELGESSATFHLRPDATFYPSGNPVTAEDVKWSLTRALNGLNAQDLTTNGMQSPDDVEIVDEHTVTLHFRDSDGAPVAPTTTTLAIYMMPQQSIVDSVAAMEHATEADPDASDWLRANTAGTGPYYVSDHQPGQELTLSAVPGHTADPYYTDVIIRIVNDANMASLLRAGEIDMGEYNLSITDMNALEEAGLTIASEPAPRMTYLGLAADTGPFADKTVRQAIAYALPYDMIVDAVYFGRAKRALSFVPSTSSAATDAWAMYDTDIERARALMEEAGSPEISVPLHYGSTNRTQEDIALLIQGSLRQIGIDVTLTPHTDAEQWDVVNARSQPAEGVAPAAPEMVLFNWGAWADDPKIPVGFSSTTGGVNNYSLWADPAVDEINATWQMQPNSPERDAAYKKAQEIIADAAAVIPITYADRAVVLAPGITGASFMVFPQSRFDLLEAAE